MIHLTFVDIPRCVPDVTHESAILTSRFLWCCHTRTWTQDWLNKNIHDSGCTYASADELLEAVTGKRLNPDIFVKYLETKYSDIYGL